MEVSVYEAKARLSELLSRAEKGDEVVITRHGRAIIKLVPVTASARRVLGRLKGRIHISKDFDAPLPDDIIDAFEGGE
jgi:prevent-host-death family protein